MIVNKQLAKKLLKSTELGRSYFFLNHSVEAAGHVTDVKVKVWTLVIVPLT